MGLCQVNRILLTWSGIFISDLLPYRVMKDEAGSPEEYIEKLHNERKDPMARLRSTILDNLPEGYTETMAYGMIGYVVPHSLYPKGYHADPQQPLPFISLASQKNHIALYHMGLYSNPELMKWFADEYPNHSPTRLDMGKSCIRFRKTDDIPFQLVAELCRKMSVQDWIQLYESLLPQ